ncbi:hypothetical protein AAFF_G00352770 [Aldrovandia affinis]|uniref:Uncharacterized protein n=1 Tax=Aldrovandia affinis TaxID=143900 RepID=A0AAD7SIY6_9TELE|nr:hypothetical protein AAFF_G00352770 [Aldrovandia affinis]
MAVPILYRRALWVQWAWLPSRLLQFVYQQGRTPNISWGHVWETQFPALLCSHPPRPHAASESFHSQTEPLRSSC